MAKTPRKTQDPTQAALSAIEEALNIGDAPASPEPAKPASNDEPRRGRDGGSVPVPPAVGPHMDEPLNVRRRPAGGRRLAHAPANDDRQSVGQILGALHARPPRMPLYVAAIASAWWIVMGVLIGYSRAYNDISQSAGLLDLIDLPYFWLFFATVVIPPVLFFTIAAMVRRTQEMRLVSRAMTEVTLRLAEPEGVSTDAVVSVSQAIRREVAALGDGIERAIARASELETMVRNEVATLERAYDENELRVRALVDELQSERDAIVSHGTRLREAIGGAHESFSIDVEGVAANIDRTLTEATDRINASLTESTTRITDGFLTQAETARVQATEASESVLDSFSTRGTELAERLGQVGIEVANALDSRTARLTESMNNSMEKLVEAISTKGNEVHEVLTVRLAASEEAIARHGNQIADRIASDTSSLSQRIAENVQGFENTLKTHGPTLGEQISQAVDYLTDQTRAALTSLDERTAGKLRETSESLDSRIVRIEQTIDARTQSLNETLANRTLELARTIADGSKVASEAVDKTIAGMGEYFASKAQEIATTISDRAEAVDQTLGKRALEMTENLDSRIQRFEDQVSGKLGGIAETIETRGVALTETLVGKLDQASAAIVTKLDETSSSFVGKLEAASSSLAGRLDEVSSAVVNKTENVTKSLHAGAAEVEHTLSNLSQQITQTLVERTGETVRGFAEQTQQIAATHEALRENVVGSLDKLVESNRLFKQLLQGVTESLEPLENAVAKRVTNMQSALENTVSTTRSSVDWLDNQMNELRNVSSGVLRDLAAVTQRFEGQGRYIASVAETLSETHGRIDQSLEERREAIEHIIRMLVDRTAAIEENFGDRSQQIGERLAGFNRLLQESLTTAEQRAQDIARHIIDSTNQISSTINKQHEVIRAGYSEERGRTATALKTAYEEAMEEMKQMFSELQERFTETAREVRDVAGEVQTSLDQTRVELKRGVLELPHETRESADAMRRVVADQLKALAELNEIVSRHAREMEAVEPTRGYYREDAAVAGGGRFSSPPDTASVTEIATARPRAAQARGEPIEFRRPRREQAEAPARRQSPRAVPAARNDDGERGGWLTDLLHKPEEAQQDDEPEHTVESLDALSLDIARMIDHDAAVELWDRHKRGERGIFTRRLYTAQGQKTFDEIRRRYRKNNEFRETVDRYIDEFERLLDQVSRDDRGQVLSKTYLTSDTGKVYTLLAHAASRLN